jgi:hypothetical protein
VTGNVADEEAVPKAVVKAFVMLAINLNGQKFQRLKDHFKENKAFKLT